MMPILENWVVNLDEPMGDIRETLEVVGGRIGELDSIRDQLKDFVLDSLDFTVDKLMARDDALEAMLTTFKEEITKLKGELMIYKAALNNEMLASGPKQRAMDVLKPKDFNGTRDDEPKEAPMKLCLIVGVIKNNRAKGYEKKLMGCFLCCGLHRLWDYPKQSKLVVTNRKD
ncbi:hypothetical protein J1N35_015267 [Gossypium stocksii]|uniref:Uncharacterized protein n=1 Tax=Gossypium stocksii TaxID=47602 RepID=A0A9D4AAJ3_9ROSI|nr:hypothetical protein J1N35_015267 [Gossypium stocksii]